MNQNPANPVLLRWFRAGTGWWLRARCRRDKTAGIAYNCVTGRHIFGHHCPSTDDGAIADGHAFENDGPGADENAAPDDNGFGNLAINLGAITPAEVTGRHMKIVIHDQRARAEDSSFADGDR